MRFKPVIALVAVIVIGVGAYLAVFGLGAKAPVEHACTMEAKICPDGSAVGRSGPNCEFAACPTATPTPPAGATSATVQTTMGQKATGLGVSLTPLELVSDSRCPIDVQCIWAGTVEVKVHIESGSGTSDMTLTLGKPVTTEREEITLTEVSPAKSSGTSIAASSYRFTFVIKKR